MYDVAIIGCGIVGASAAFELAKHDISVIVLERGNDVAVGTTKANSAIIHAGYDPEPGTLMAKLNVEGNALTGQLCDLLDVPFKRCGSLVLAFSPHERSILEKMYAKGRENGVPDLEIVEKERLRLMEPNVSTEAVAALYAPSAGIVSPWELTLAMMETAVNNGVELRLESEVKGIQTIDGGYRIITGEQNILSRYILNAAGIHSDTVHNMVAEPTFRIIPDKGVYYLLDKSEGNRVNHVVFQCPSEIGKGTLVAPTVHGNLIVGPNNESPNHPDDVATTATGLAFVAKTAKKSVPSVNFRESIRNFAGVRAASNEYDFIIAAAKDAPGLIDLAGIKSPGLTAAPAIAKMAVELLRENGLNLERKKQFTCERKRVRFAELSVEERMEAVKKNSAYGRVVCRCETVTEGEILDALRSPIPPRSVDGLKRRTGAGMGRCQGGFCGPRLVELLARAWGGNPLEILQDQPGTILFTVKPRRAMRNEHV